ncbi:thyroid peroxidase [Tachysurus fulvidraco]|uniref:thyroid peroxidase n=1 Tax=Tachysurus fulvidraco TaxID=1234273 RepID=UPI001FEE32A7|nr:thyroid peroxidase [Tachysurus fulvidraco]
MFNSTPRLLLCCILFSCTPTDKTPSEQKLNNSETLLISSIQESLQMVNKALHETEKRNHSQPSYTEMFALSRQAAAAGSNEIINAAEVFQTILQLLKKKESRRQKRSVSASEFLSLEEVKLIANLSGCPSPLQPASCPIGGDSEKYRTISGVCNNRNKPLWGAASTVLARWLPAEYEDGESQPKGWNIGHQYRGFHLPPVREVSNKIMQISSECCLEDEAYSQMLVDWGQYIDHDISFTPQSTSKAAFLEGVNCLHMCGNSNPCFPIQIPLHDELFGSKSCLPFFRSAPACLNGPTHTLHPQQLLQRQQMNSITSFLDASTVYGHSIELQKMLRNFSSSEGLLTVNSEHTDTAGRAYLPFVNKPTSACFQEPGTGLRKRLECFLAGDSRVNEILPLIALHTVWVREHNRIATQLKELNTHWSANTIYQESRKIVGALHQIITMRDYIPKIIGEETFNQTIGPYDGYDDAINPSISNVFATAAFRFGHATISTHIRRLNESFQEHDTFPSLKLHQTFFSPWRIIKEGGLDPILRGLISQPAARQNQHHLMNEELKEKLMVLTIPEALDLAALNLQRGRDHGLPGYNDWRVFCGYDRVQSKADLKDVIHDRALVEKIMDLYGHPDNIDVWLAGLLEDPVPGTRTGPLFACLIGKQMKMLREGDRFWWEKPGVFSQQQRQELQRHSLSRVLCDNSGLTEVPIDPFSAGKYPEHFRSCTIIPSMDLDVWKENPEKCSTC